MSAVSLGKAPSFEQLPKPEAGLEKAMARTIKAINVLVLDKPFERMEEEDDLWSTPQEVQFSKGKSLSWEAFERLFTSQDVVLIPQATIGSHELLRQLETDFFIHYGDKSSSFIALNPKTWGPHTTHIVTGAPAFTLLAQQRDGRQVLLSCGQFKDEQAFAQHVHTLHRRQQLSNKDAEYPQGWTEVVAAFNTPISRKQVLSTVLSWQWSSKIPSMDDVAIAKNILGTSWHLDENPQCTERLIQRQITWAPLSDTIAPPAPTTRMKWKIKGIHATVLPKLQILYPWSRRNVVDCENNTMTQAAFKKLVSSFDVVFIPNPTAEERLELARFGFQIEAVALEPSIIGLNRKTWNSEVKLITTTNRLETMPYGITILAKQKDGRPVLLSCYKFNTESDCATQMEWLHGKYQSINRKQRVERGWMEAIAAFDTPFSRKCFPSHFVSAHWHWSSKVPEASDVSLAKHVLGATCLLDENPQCTEGLTQRQITWPSASLEEDMNS